MDKTQKELIVEIDDLDKDDDLVILSKEIENTKLDDTIDLSEYFNKTIGVDINNKKFNKTIES